MYIDPTDKFVLKLQLGLVVLLLKNIKTRELLKLIGEQINYDLQTTGSTRLDKSIVWSTMNILKMSRFEPKKLLMESIRKHAIISTEIIMKEEEDKEVNEIRRLLSEKGSRAKVNEALKPESLGVWQDAQLEGLNIDLDDIIDQELY